MMDDLPLNRGRIPLTIRSRSNQPIDAGLPLVAIDARYVDALERDNARYEVERASLAKWLSIVKVQQVGSAVRWLQAGVRPPETAEGDERAVYDALLPFWDRELTP